MDNPIRNIKMVLAYEGTNYAGFQRQSNGPTIQGLLEDKLAMILNCKVKIIGSGRTDAGVHAYGQVVNFKTVKQLSALKIQKALNSLLPEDILIRSAEETVLDFHARYSSKNKTYSYNIYNDEARPLFNRNFVYYYRHHLDLERMKDAAALLVGKHDFKSFQAAGSTVVNTIRTIHFCHLYRTGLLIKVLINADGFLYHMVRNIVGSLILVGNGKWSIEGFKNLIEKKDRTLAGPTAPAKGLCLEEVFY
jgi:tRNA pseudouridine38-40 synthase